MSGEKFSFETVGNATRAAIAPLTPCEDCKVAYDETPEHWHEFATGTEIESTWRCGPCAAVRGAAMTGAKCNDPSPRHAPRSRS